MKYGLWEGGAQLGAAVFAASYLCAFAPARVLAQPSPMEAAVEHAATGPDRLVLVFDEQRLNDADRAQLIAYVSMAVPVAEWQTVIVKVATPIETLIDTYYDLYQRRGDPYRLPYSVKAMTVEIQRGNPGIESVVPAGAELRLPPFPVRARGRYGYDDRGAEAFRIFDTRSHAYATKQRIETALLATQPLIAAAGTMGPQRDATATGIVLDVRPELLKPGVQSVALPNAVLALSAHPSRAGGPVVQMGMLKVSLLNDPSPQPCASAFSWLNASPFREAQRAAMASLSSTDRDRMKALARETPLVVLDAGFSSGHGSKVRTVVSAMLKELGLPELDDAVEEFELLPIDDEARHSLSKALEEYLASKPAVPDDQIERARLWIRDTIATEDTRTIDMPEVLLQAVFWKYFTDAAWLNMSFRTDSGALRVIVKKFQPSRALSFVAAGNDHAELPPGWVPQDGASTSRHFVIVTHGDETGRVDGDYTREGAGPPVALVAPGCGFEGIAETGSSLAAPYVAAAVWARYLLDRVTLATQPSVRALLHDLQLASRPVPAQRELIESGGFLDPAHLFCQPSRPHLLRTAPPRVDILKTFNMSVRCTDGTTREYSFPLTVSPRHYTVTTHQSADGITLWAREILPGRAPFIDRACTIASLEFTGDTTKAQNLKLDRDSFTKEVTSLTW